MADRRLSSLRHRAFRPSPVFIALLALWVTGGVMAWQGFGNATVNIILFVIAGWLVTLSLHEFGHAVLAYRAGDRAVAERGYLTLNPLKYAHPVLSIALPVLFLLLGGIGLPGGAVWIDRHAVRGRLQDTLISAAGPGVNVVFALLMTVPFLVGVNIAAHLEFWAAWAFLAFLQVTAALLNLVPIPGVDGGNMLRPWLSPVWGRRFDLFAPYGMLLLIVLLFEPTVNGIFFEIVFWISDIIGLPPGLWALGREMFQFWR